MNCAYKGCRENGIHRVRVPGQVTQTLDVCLQHQILLEGMMAKICLVTVCDSTQAAKGLCSVHYQRFRYYKLVPEGGIKDAAQADAIAAEWRKLSEEARAKAAPPIPKAPKVESAYLTVSAGPALPPPPLVKVVHPVTAPARPTASKLTGQAATGPGSARLRKLQADLDEMTQARDRLAEDRKGLAQQVKDLTEKLSRVEGAQDQPSPVEAERDAMRAEIDRLTTEASAIATITREYGHDLGRIYADLEAALTFGGTNVDPEYRDPKYADLVRRVLGRINDLSSEVKRLRALDERMQAVRDALTDIGLPAMDNYAAVVRCLVRQRDEAPMALLAEFGDAIGKPVEHGEKFGDAKIRLLGFAQEWCRRANGDHGERDRVVEGLKRENADLIARVSTLTRTRDDLEEMVRRQPSTPPAQSIPASTRLAALLRESLPLRLAFVDAIQANAHRTLRKAAEDPAIADSMAADLLQPDAG